MGMITRRMQTVDFMQSSCGDHATDIYAIFVRFSFASTVCRRFQALVKLRKRTFVHANKSQCDNLDETAECDTLKSFMDCSNDSVGWKQAPKLLPNLSGPSYQLHFIPSMYNVHLIPFNPWPKISLSSITVTTRLQLLFSSGYRGVLLPRR